MTAEIINLGRARKRRARAEKAGQASENRIRFGRTKAELQRLDSERAIEAKRLDGARRAPNRDDGDAS